ncbi:aliphatic sulfonate ABC transporter substrate-binding protein [Clostridium akagii]|uniref:aliphatic sulfonate ABC transporter substrate-binding protein n=1 Tax=Clostridium akagii TaxID=91623 RepID=UPI0009FC4F80|nr:aliphatic sulfonate ABC transporter substrate-binding protein [Clostridium akagii]
MKKTLLTLAIIGTLAAGVLAGCNAKKSDDAQTVRIAYFPNITHSQALVGMEEGKFKKALGDKVTIQWKQFNAGSSEVEAFLSGSVDIGYIGPGPAINGYTKSKGDLQVIAGATDSGAVLVSRKGENIKSVKDLANKKVAIPQFGNTQDLTLRFLLANNGLQDKTKGGNVEIVAADNPDIVTLLDKGSIDAALVPEPWGSRIQKQASADLVLDSNKVWRNGKYPTALVVARKEFIKDHPDVIENFLKAHVELTDYINTNKDKAADDANIEFKTLTKKALDKDVLKTSFSRLSPTVDPEKNATKAMIDMSLKVGFIKEKPADENGLFNLDILNKVLKAKGEKTIN